MSAKRVNGFADNGSWRSAATCDDDDDPEDVEVFPKPPHKGYGSLEKIYPHRSSRDLDELCLLNQAADIFLECLGFRETLKMSSAAFRTFVRSVVECLLSWRLKHVVELLYRNLCAFVN